MQKPTKLWQKNTETSPEVEAFTVGNDRDLDLLLAPYDILGSIAHAMMLGKVGLLDESETRTLCAELRNIYHDSENNGFVIDDGVEDVHSQVENLLTERLGETGKRIHTGRSRNDQVLLDLKLFSRAGMKEIVQNSQVLFDQLINLSETYKEYLLPGYTHFQAAMPSSLGLWFGAYAESLVDDLTVLQAAYKVTNRNPLGSGAGFGSSLPLDREYTSQLLGFDSPNYNVVYAQMTRGKTERLVSAALASIASTLGRMSADVCLYMSQNFGFISFPDHLTTGSSIMPHKKNPDVFELIRARCNKLQALPNELALICANLPSGYHRDMQQIKESYLPAFEVLNSCLRMMNFMLQSIEVKKDILDDPKYKFIFSVEAVNALVNEGVPFRDAYKQVGAQIADGSFDKPESDLLKTHTHLGSIGNLGNNEIRKLMDQTIKSFDFEKVESALKALIKA